MPDREKLLSALDALFNNQPGLLAEYYTLHEHIVETTKEERKIPSLLKRGEFNEVV